MEEKSARDLGEEIIYKLEELSLVLERIIQKHNNEKKCSATFNLGE